MWLGSSLPSPFLNESTSIQGFIAIRASYRTLTQMLLFAYNNDLTIWKTKVFSLYQFNHQFTNLHFCSGARQLIQNDINDPQTTLLVTKEDCLYLGRHCFLCNIQLRQEEYRGRTSRKTDDGVPLCAYSMGIQNDINDP